MKIYVGNIDASTGDEQLREAFATHGEVSSAVVVTDRDTGERKRFGFVEMPGIGEAQNAITALNDSMLGPSKLVVSEARGRAEGTKPAGDRRPGR